MNTTYETVIEQIAQSVFSTMTYLELVRTDQPPTPDQESLLASVHIAGEWTGILGKCQTIMFPSGSSPIVIPFRSDLGPVSVQVGLIDLSQAPCTAEMGVAFVKR